MRAKVLNDFENLFIESSKKLERIRKKTPYGSPLGGETGSSMPSESFPSGLESGENDFDGLYRSLSGDECEKTLTDLVTRIPPIAREYRRKGLLGCTGPKVDVLEYTLEQFKLWNREVDLLRRTPEDSPPTGVGFITFSSPLSAVRVNLLPFKKLRLCESCKKGYRLTSRYSSAPLCMYGAHGP